MVCGLTSNASQSFLISFQYEICVATHGEIEEKDFREKFPATIRAEDGHKVRSRAEQLIDNWLYHKGIVHAYERRVPIEEEVYSDFFIPIGQKVWIEFWGLTEQKYEKRKREIWNNLIVPADTSVLEMHSGIVPVSFVTMDAYLLVGLQASQLPR